MSELQEHFEKPQGLLAALSAVTHRPAFITLYASYILALLLSFGLAAITVAFASRGYSNLSIAVVAIGFLLATLVILLGISATGYLLSNRRGTVSIGSAILFAVTSFPRLIGALAILALLALLMILAVFIFMLICKIPAIGPVLYAVLLPVSVLLLGMTSFACGYLAILTWPSILARNSVVRTVTLMVSIFRERLLTAAVQFILLSLLAGVVAILVLGILVMGLLATGAIAATILHVPYLSIFDIFYVLHDLVGGGDMGGGGGYIVAAIFGTLLLLGLVFSITGLVGICGSCIIFANVTENLSTEKVDGELRSALAAVRQSYEDGRRSTSETSATAATSVAAVGTAATPASVCAQCSAPIQQGEMFCGSCGHKLS